MKDNFNIKYLFLQDSTCFDIQKVDSYTDLGVMFDRKLTFNTHIQEKNKEGKQYIGHNPRKFHLYG